MAVQFNHTIVLARDRKESAEFLAGILGVPAPRRSEPFLMVQMDNGVTLDFMNAGGEIVPQHYAFLVDEDEFDEIFGRIRARGLQYWAGPSHQGSGMINNWNGGRGVYFDDPNGHALEVLTRP